MTLDTVLALLLGLFVGHVATMLLIAWAAVKAGRKTL